ncbi:MAG: DUF262 domain-containing protein [Desulfobacterales bacterium]|nr:DUF262 domain-containing protein [Desulfobacterales bacterium]
MQIYQILDKIDDNQLFVPAFQREYVWRKDDAKKLMSSLIKEYPTGTMLTWETTNPPELKGNVKYDERMGSVKLILDGQQRITTLYMLIRGKIPPYYTKEEIKNDPRKLYVNLETLELEYYKIKKMQNNPLWAELTEIFLGNIKYRHIIKALKSKGDTITDERDDLIYDNFSAIEKICDRDFVEQVIPVHANIREAINIFYIVNASGVNLSDAELALAQISGYWPKARERFKSKLFSMEKEGFVFSLDFIVYVLLGVLHHGGSEMTKLHSPENKERLINAWDQLESQTLDYLINILRQHFFIDHTKEINSVYALVPIIVYTFNKGKNHLTGEEIQKIKKWFYYSQIRQRYVSQLPQKLDKDVGIVVKSEQPFDDLLNIIKLERSLEITSDEFVGRDIRHPLYALMRWYFKSQNAVCFSTGIGIRRNMGEKYMLEWDHIFPYSVLKDNGYNPKNRIHYSLMQEITNRAILTQVANRTKSNLMPEDYLAWVENRFPDALRRQCIPMDKNLWKIDRFRDFLEARRRMLADELNAFLQAITETQETEMEMSVEELISEGESNELEFKSSLRWDYRQGKVNSELEQVVLKTLAAFSNSDGGTLLIGVKDDGELLGLQPDFNSLNGNKDKFELHLRNLINKTFGKVFATNNINIGFYVLDDEEICKIEIKKGEKPQFIEETDRHGKKIKKFYARSGNSSQEFAIDEATEFIKSRFNNS